MLCGGCLNGTTGPQLAMAGSKGHERDTVYSSRPIDENTKLNIEFLEAMPDEEAEKYRGEWIAVAGGRIVAHGKDPEMVHEKGCDANRGVPHMEYIYASPEEVPWLYIPKE